MTVDMAPSLNWWCGFSPGSVPGQRPVDLVPSRVDALGAGRRITGAAGEVVERRDLVEVGQHGAPPGHLALTAEAHRRAAHLDLEKPRGDLPEAGGIEPRADGGGAERPEV